MDKRHQHGIAGLGGYRDARPTGRNLLDALAELRLIPATANAPPIVPAPTGLQARVVQGTSDPFGVPPAVAGRNVVQIRGDHSLRSDLAVVAGAIREWLPQLLDVRPEVRRRLPVP